MNAMSDDLPGQTGEPAGGRPWDEIFLDLARGKARALEEIYDAAAGRIFGLALWRTGSREDACDVVQEVFVRMAEQGERLRKVRNPRAWVLTVAHRVAVDATRRRRRSESLESCRFLESTQGDADRGLDAERASSLLAGLPPAQRETVYLRHFAGCTFSEIGAVTGVPTFTAASRYRLGIAKLRELMGGKR
jgi:RNA polymerase sigma-70 factor (ECF subfamily)